MEFSENQKILILNVFRILSIVSISLYVHYMGFKYTVDGSVAQFLDLSSFSSISFDLSVSLFLAVAATYVLISMEMYSDSTFSWIQLIFHRLLSKKSADSEVSGDIGEHLFIKARSDPEEESLSRSFFRNSLFFTIAFFSIHMEFRTPWNWQIIFVLPLLAFLFAFPISQFWRLLEIRKAIRSRSVDNLTEQISAAVPAVLATAILLSSILGVLRYHAVSKGDTFEISISGKVISATRIAPIRDGYIILDREKNQSLLLKSDFLAFEKEQGIKP